MQYIGSFFLSSTDDKIIKQICRWGSDKKKIMQEIKRNNLYLSLKFKNILKMQDKIALE